MDLVEYLTASLDLRNVDELAGGHQSRVFRAVRRDGAPVAVKAIDAAEVDRRELEVRLSVVDALADLDCRICRPLPLTDDPVIHVAMPNGEDRFIIGYEFAFGEQPEPGEAADAKRMGTALAQLHESMRRLPAVPLPAVSALRATSMDADVASGQLLHGDFSASNVRQTDEGVRIFDFDDCGFGPAEFDVANALYMVLFDQTTGGTPHTFDTFRRSFIDGYRNCSGPSISLDAVDDFIDLRVRALAIWLEDLDSAPIGIRTAPGAWHETGSTRRSVVDGLGFWRRAESAI